MGALGLRARVLHAGETTIRDGAEAVARLLEDGPLDAVVAINDAMALGAVHALRGTADAPAVVGFDDIAWAALADPPLTTVAVDAAAMGARAAELLLRRIADPTAAPTTERITATIRIRRSCGCPAAGAQQEDHRSWPKPGLDHQRASGAARGEGPHV
jgi:LacI family transcriptional regulator